MAHPVGDQEPATPLPVRSFSRLVGAASGPGRLWTLPVILFGCLMAFWLFFDAALDQRRTPHTTLVALASGAALVAVVATLVALLGMRANTFLWIAAAGFATAAILCLVGHLTLLSGLGITSPRLMCRQLAGYSMVAGPPVLVGLVLAYACRWLARTVRWSMPW